MKLQDCYVQLEGDYSGVLSRLMREATVGKFLGMILKDRSIEDLRTGIANSDWELAFRAVHTLKGTCLNLGVTKLAGYASELTEVLRAGAPTVDIAPMVQAIEDEYARTMAIVTEYVNNPE